MSRSAIVVLAAIPVAILLVFLYVPAVVRQPWTPLRIAGAILAVIGYPLLITARVQLGRSFAVMPQATELVTHGLYSRIRHPIYVFADMTALGLIFALRVYWLLFFVAVWMVGQALQAGREAKVLQEKFGQMYLDYRKRTWF